MGCAQSDMAPGNEAGHNSGGKGKRKNRDKSAANNSNNTEKQANPLNNNGPAEGTLSGKQKYIVEVGAITMDVTDKQISGGGIVVVFAPNETAGLSVAFRSKANNTIYVRDLTDQQLQKEKDNAGIIHGWAPFFKSVAAEVMKSKAKVTMQSGHVVLEVSITSTKDPKAQPFSFKLEPKSGGKQSKVMFKYMLEPMTRMVQRKHIADRDKELRYARAECDLVVKEASLERHRETIDRLTPVITPLRETGANHSKQASQVQSQVAGLERRLRRLKQAKEGKHQLDAMYDEGGARFFMHLSHADEHAPRELPFSDALCDLIKAKFPLKSGEDIQTITRPPANPQLARLLEQAPKRMAQQTMQVLTKLDSWDFNVFELERATDNNALFYVTYALMYKMDLVNTFDMSDATLRNFLKAVQAGYHPNPYHNATHAADVAQINYFIMCNSGLSDVCGLSREDMLASLLAGAIHDYDHPGFNNSFHTRTNAYLSTLYNDRSVLENHHVACVYEILRKEKFDIFKSLDEEKKRDIRDTIIEMVLSTDMGNHAKIFSTFRRRLTENTEWKSRREDARLALSMSIKMADISNCSRPNHLYVEWAKNIANEFYNQGDVEGKLKLQISPFMDRRKDKTDFPKGQTSFMNYIVIPMLEVIAEFLPKMEFAVMHCTENKDYWNKHSNDGSRI